MIGHHIRFRSKAEMAACTDDEEGRRAFRRLIRTRYPLHVTLTNGVLFQPEERVILLNNEHIKEIRQERLNPELVFSDFKPSRLTASQRSRTMSALNTMFSDDEEVEGVTRPPFTQPAPSPMSSHTSQVLSQNNEDNASCDVRTPLQPIPTPVNRVWVEDDAPTRPSHRGRGRMEHDYVQASSSAGTRFVDSFSTPLTSGSSTMGPKRPSITSDGGGEAKTSRKLDFLSECPRKFFIHYDLYDHELLGVHFDRRVTEPEGCFEASEESLKMSTRMALKSANIISDSGIGYCYSIFGDSMNQIMLILHKQTGAFRGHSMSFSIIQADRVVQKILEMKQRALTDLAHTLKLRELEKASRLRGDDKHREATRVEEDAYIKYNERMKEICKRNPILRYD